MKTIAQQINWDFEANGKLVIKDKKGNRIYFERADGFWAKYEYDSQGNCIYYEDSDGVIKDNRPKSCEGKIVEFDGEKYKLVKI